MVAKYSLLIVDDEPEICEVLHEYMNSLGVFKYIVEAYDGVAATVKIVNQSFDIILLDINLPKKDGTKIVAQLAEINPKYINSVIIVSGELNEDAIKKIAKFGIKHFIVKPFDENTVKHKVLSVLKQNMKKN